MSTEKRMLKLFEFGDKNNIAVTVLRFSQVSHVSVKDRRLEKNDGNRTFEVKFIEPKNGHRFSVGRSEELSDAMDLVWKHYKRKD